MTDPEPAAARVRDAYREYGSSPRRRRSWSAKNRGNIGMRAELEAAIAASGALDGIASARVLDVGCGHGYWLRRLGVLGAAPERLTGVDLLPERVAAASSALTAATILEADALDLPFSDESFDLILLFTVLSSVADEARVKRVLEEARRVSAAGGVILVYEPRLPNPLNRATRRISRRELAAVLGRPSLRRSLTVLPALARGLGPATARLYPALARVPPLRTHHLLMYRLDPG